MLYFAASIVTAVDREKRAADLADLEDKVKGESEQIYVDRDEQLAALDERLARRRAFLSAGKDKGFDEDDEFWARGLSNWAEDQVLPGLEDARTLAGGIFPALAGSIAGEDPEADPRARPSDRDARRPAARAARDRVGRDRGAGDPRRARAAPRGAREVVRLEEGRDHEAPPQAARPAARRRGALGRRRRARRIGRREEPRAGPRDRQRPAARRARARRGRSRRRAGARARVRPLPRRGRPQGGPRGRPAVGDEGQGDGRRHRQPARGRARGGGRGRPPARGDVEAVPRARRQAGRQRRADLP